MTTRIILADDHKIVRAGIKSVLEKNKNYEVVAEADDGRQLIRLVQKFNPDIVLMDIMMPNLNGIDATIQLFSEFDRIKVLVLSMYTDKRYVKAMMKLGASGYLTKNCSSDHLFKAISAALKDEIYLCQKIANELIKDYLINYSLDEVSNLYTLTSTEREVLQLLSEGMKTRDIAKRMHISVHTVNTHRRNIMKKTDMKNNAQLTKFAIKEGMTTV